MGHKFLLMDSNILFKAVACSSDYIYELAIASSTFGYTLLIPKVLLQEHSAVLFRQSYLEGSTEDREKFRNKLSKYLKIELGNDINAGRRTLMSSYPVLLTERLGQLFRYVKRVDYPNVDISDMMNRAVFKLKPFHSDKYGNVGDFLLWLSAATQLGGADLISFVTGDMDGFRSSDNDVIPAIVEPTLVELAGERGYRTELFPSVDVLLTHLGVEGQISHIDFNTKSLSMELFARVVSELNSQASAFSSTTRRRFTAVTHDPTSLKATIKKLVKVKGDRRQGVYAAKMELSVCHMITEDISQHCHYLKDLSKQPTRYLIWLKLLAQNDVLTIERVIGIRPVEFLERDFIQDESSFGLQMLGEFIAVDTTEG